MLKQRALGRTGLTVSELGMGCSSFWAKAAFPERQAIALVEQALAGGVTYFDTGPTYAAGEAERRLGLALRGAGAAPLVISTKIGTHVGPRGKLVKDWSAAALRESLSRSLERLGRDRVELLLLHGPQIGDLTETLCEALAGLKREGLALAVGVNSFDGDVVRRALTLPIFDAFMVEYNVLHKGNAVLLGEIAAAGGAAIAGTPVAQALFRPARSLLPTSVKAAWELARALKNHRKELSAARRYRFLNRLPGMTGAQAALAFVLRDDAVASAVFGTTSERHLAENLAAAAIALPPEVLAQINDGPDAA